MTWTTAPGGKCSATEDAEHQIGQRQSGALAGPCAACDAEGQVQVDVETGRVFLRLGNYEFEVLVPPTLQDSDPHAADHTADLLQRQLSEWRSIPAMFADWRAGSGS